MFPGFFLPLGTPQLKYKKAVRSSNQVVINYYIVSRLHFFILRL